MSEDFSATPRRGRHSINLRADPELRWYMSQAAAKHEHSMSAEIEQRCFLVRILEAAAGFSIDDETWQSPLERLLVQLEPLLPPQVMQQIRHDASALADAPGNYVYRSILFRIYAWRLAFRSQSPGAK